MFVITKNCYIFTTLKSIIMETYENDLEKKIKDEIEVGFKKLNFALRSYSKDFTAEYSSTPEGNVPGIFFRLLGPTKEMLTYRFENWYEAFDQLTDFKKEAINICSHQKKERH